MGACPVRTLIADPAVAVVDQHDGSASVDGGGGLLVEGSPGEQQADVEQEIGYLGRSQHAAFVHALQALVDDRQGLNDRFVLEYVAHQYLQHRHRAASSMIIVTWRRAVNSNSHPTRRPSESTVTSPVAFGG